MKKLSKRYKLLEYLKKRGKKGGTGLDFVAFPLFCLDYRKMICDLIEDGYNITKKREKNHKRYYFITK